MAYHIPSDDEVLGAVRKVFQKYHTVTSQHKLKKFVEKELHTKKKQFHVSEQRLRMLVLNSGLASAEIRTREGNPDKILHKCPVCGGSLQRVKIRRFMVGR